MEYILDNKKNITVKDMPDSLKPRERLIKFGPETLNDYELLAIILGSGIKGLNVIDLSKMILSDLCTINDMKNITINELCNIKGIKKNKATLILASIEFGKRVTNYIEDRFFINNTNNGYYYLKNKLENKEEEIVIAIYLNNKSEVVGEKIISIGSVSESIFDYKKIMKYAIKYGVNHILIAHNHPSGDPSPSLADIEATKTLIELADSFEIKVIDHLIIGKGKYYSYYKKKVINVLP